MSRQDVDIIPGTEIVFKERSDEPQAGELVLIPRPTPNQEDPLVSMAWRLRISLPDISAC